MEGCWLTLADDRGRTVRVEVPRDEADAYEYTFPTDVNGADRPVGRHARGRRPSPSQDQRHYAEDGGATAAKSSRPSPSHGRRSS